MLTSRTADSATGARLFFKCENLQRMGAFKFRGGYNALAQFTPAQRKTGAIAFSSGNHAQAVALSARLLDMPAVIVMPQDAPPLKIEATRDYLPPIAGAEVILYNRYTEDREAIGRRIAAERGMTLIPPYNHPHVMAGQGTAALEMFEQVREIDGGSLDLLLVCVGGGGLISGCATAAKALAPGCRVIGVEPEAGNDVQQSLRKGEIVHIDVPRTIFAERMKLVVEPTGALAAAAAFEGAVALRGLRVGVIVSGGNIDLRRYADLIGGAADA